MIGDVPAGAPLRCRLGQHKPKPGGGLSVYKCALCEGVFWQPLEVREQLKYAEAAIKRDDWEEARRIHREALESVGQVYVEKESFHGS